jgi:hypothetical protein
MNSIIESVVKSCFDVFKVADATKTTSSESLVTDSNETLTFEEIFGSQTKPASGQSGTGSETPIGDGNSGIPPGVLEDILNGNKKIASEFEDLQSRRVRFSPTQISHLDFAADPTPEQNDVNGIKFIFKFKSDVTKNNKTAFVSALDLETTLAKHELAVVIKSENEDRSSEKKVTVTDIGSRKFKAGQGAKSFQPLQSGLRVNKGDQIRIAATFSPATVPVVRPYLMGPVTYAIAASQMKAKPFVWKAEYKADEKEYRLEQPEDALYYRVGMSPWRSVGKYTVIPIDVLDGGEVQFYVDKEAIYRQLPSKKRTSYLWGAWQASIPYENFLPNFEIEISGKRYEIK